MIDKRFSDECWKSFFMRINGFFLKVKTNVRVVSLYIRDYDSEFEMKYLFYMSG